MFQFNIPFQDLVRGPMFVMVAFRLNSLPPGKFFHAFLSSADFFQNQVFRKIISGIPSECQTDWIQIRPDILSGLICVQSVSRQ